MSFRPGGDISIKSDSKKEISLFDRNDNNIFQLNLTNF